MLVAAVSPSFALQVMMHERLTADPAVTTLVPADDITDASPLQAVYPSIRFSEGREYPLGSVKRSSSRVALDLHVWTDTAGTAEAKAITAAVRRALRDDPWSAEGHIVMDLAFVSARFMPDPANADITHGVVTFDAMMLEAE